MEHQCWPARWPLMAVLVSGSMASADAARQQNFINSGPYLAADVVADMGSISDDSTDEPPIPDILRRAVIQAFIRKL